MLTRSRLSIDAQIANYRQAESPAMEKARETFRYQHAADAINTREQFMQPMKQHQSTDSKA